MIRDSLPTCLYFFLAAAGIVLTSQGLQGLRPGNAVKRANKLYQPLGAMDYMFSLAHCELLWQEARQLGCSSWGSLLLLLSIVVGIARLTSSHVGPVPTLDLWAIIMSISAGAVVGVLGDIVLRRVTKQSAAAEIERKLAEAVRSRRVNLNSAKAMLKWFERFAGREPRLPETPPIEAD